jgi:hypothetical protein
VSCPWMNHYWTMEDTYNIWYLKHIKVSTFKSIKIKVSDFSLVCLFSFKFLLIERVVAIMPSTTTTGQIEACIN